MKIENLTISQIYNENLNSKKWFAYPVQLIQTDSLLKSMIAYDRVQFGMLKKVAICAVVTDVSV